MRFLKYLTAMILGSAPVLADDATPWQDHQGMIRTRVVVGSPEIAPTPGRALFAWEAELAPGWKTYWRAPGEAGLPVRLRQGGDEVEILYPLPHRFELFGLETYGYGNRVMLPFELASGATELQGDFMVCKDICVPFEASYDLSRLRAEDGAAQDIRISAWLKQVPARTGDGGAGLAITDVRLMGTVGHQRIVVDVRSDTDLSSADLLAEINDMVHFGAPKIALKGDGREARIVLDAMTGNTPFELRGHDLRLTFTDGQGHAIDRLLPLD